MVFSRKPIECNKVAKPEYHYFDICKSTIIIVVLIMDGNL